MFVRYAIYIYIFHIAWRNMFLFFLQNLVREINILADKVTNILHMYILYIYIYIYIYIYFIHNAWRMLCLVYNARMYRSLLYHAFVRGLAERTFP